MACCKSKITKQELINSNIERQIRKEKRDRFQTSKLLLFGTGESGKSTFIKQMKIIHGSGYSEEEKRNSIKHIHQNIFCAMHSMIWAMDLLHIEYRNPSNPENAELVSNNKPEDITEFKMIEFLPAIKALWNDPGFQECYEKRRLYHLSESAKYYLRDIDRIASSDYYPTQEDILRARIPKSNIVDYGFTLNNSTYRMIDVGGLRSQRRKWIHCFEGFEAILFFASLGEYDQIGIESEKKTRMEESKALFKEIISSPWFSYSSFVLFLNKIDVFEEKITTSHLVDYYPEFDGPKHDSIPAREFILKMFLSLNTDEYILIYPHFLNAIDTKNTRFVFASMHDAGYARSRYDPDIIQQELSFSGRDCSHLY